MNHKQYYLDLSDEHHWLIKVGEKRYDAGKDKEIALALIVKLNDNFRANVEQRDNGLYVCWGYHEKNQACEYSIEINYAQ